MQTRRRAGFGEGRQSVAAGMHSASSLGTAEPGLSFAQAALLASQLGEMQKEAEGSSGAVVFVCLTRQSSGVRESQSRPVWCRWETLAPGRSHKALCSWKPNESIPCVRREAGFPAWGKLRNVHSVDVGWDHHSCNMFRVGWVVCFFPLLQKNMQSEKVKQGASVPLRC